LSLIFRQRDGGHERNPTRANAALLESVPRPRAPSPDLLGGSGQFARQFKEFNLDSFIGQELSLHPVLELTLLVLIGIANAVPLLAKRFLGSWLRIPIDCGLRFFDGEPLLGPTKTLPGILLSLVATALAAPLLGISWPFGLLLGAGAMAGDLFSSFIKRRLKRPPSSKSRGLDQVPESLFPAMAYAWFRALSGADIVVIVVLFFACEFAVSKLLYRLHIRDEPW
jgi:CDP-2,3-bis-(O-geranylgeranyl)-sn-glycerol synthase